MLALLWYYLHFLIDIGLLISISTTPWGHWTKPRSKKYEINPILVCCWNLKSLSAHNLKHMSISNVYLKHILILLSPITCLILRDKSSHTYEAILLEMDYDNKKITVFVIYRSPSQTYQEFDSFLTNFQKLLNEISNCKPSLL